MIINALNVIQLKFVPANRKLKISLSIFCSNFEDGGLAIPLLILESTIFKVTDTELPFVAYFQIKDSKMLNFECLKLGTIRIRNIELDIGRNNTQKKD